MGASTPPYVVGGRCRLSLVGYTCGDGGTLQEAADDLVARLLGLVMCVRTSGLSVSTECPPPDLHWLQFLWDLGQIAKRGGDIRERVFGPPARAASDREPRLAGVMVPGDAQSRIFPP